MKIIYLHGFGSAGNAHKSQLLSHAVKSFSESHHKSIEFISPDLSYVPNKVIEQVTGLVNAGSNEKLVFIGSSLGGFYAQYFSNQCPDAKIVLINPLVDAWEWMKNYYGFHKNAYTGETIEISDSFVSELKKYRIKEVHNPRRFLLLLQTDDEVLDYQQALNKFPDSPKIIRTGGGHLFSGFESVIPNILNFINE